MAEAETTAPEAISKCVSDKKYFDSYAQRGCALILSATAPFVLIKAFPVQDSQHRKSQQ